MAGYDEDFWGEDFLEGEETTETEVGTEGEEGTEGTEGTEGAEGAAVDVDGEGTEDTEGGEGEDEGFSPDLLARIEAETQKRVDARIAREFEGI